MTIDLLVYILTGLGVSKSGSGYHYLARALLLVTDVLVLIYCIHGSIFLTELMPDTSEMTFLLYATLASDVVYSASVYVWGISYVARNAESRYGPKIIFWNNVNVALILCVVAAIIRELLILLSATEFMSLYFCPQCVMIMELFFASVLKLQCYSVSLLISSVLLSYANDIRSITSEVSPRNVHEACERIEKINKTLNTQFNMFLVMFHVEYFFRLVGEIPSMSASLQCGEGGYYLLQNFGQLYVFLVVISRSDAVEKQLQKFRRKVFHVATVHRSDRLTVFLKQMLGLEMNIGFKSVLCWKTCLSFISFCWSFAFMTFQLSLAAKPWTCMN